MHVERFSVMGTRVELHLFGPVDRDAIGAARRAIEAVDAALTIHRPSPTTELNDCLMAGRPFDIVDSVLLDTLVEIDAVHRLTDGLFDPAAHAQRPAAGWHAIRFDRDNARVEALRPVALDFGGFGKGVALDRACAVLRDAQVASAFLCAGESSIAVVGEHPLGGGWPVAIPHPLAPGQFLVELELRDEALSISSTVGTGAQAPGRAPMVRPSDGACVTAPCCALAVARSGSHAEALSTALVVADDRQAAILLDRDDTRRFRFDFEQDTTIAFEPAGMTQ